MSSAPNQPDTPKAVSETPASDKRVHLYDAASTQREHVLKDFDRQRDALLQAVAEQHEAALAPIRAVQARQTAGAGVDGRVLGPRGGGPTLPTADRTQAMAEIAAAIRAIVAEEVRVQFATLLRDADARIHAAPPAD